MFTIVYSCTVFRRIYYVEQGSYRQVWVNFKAFQGLQTGFPKVFKDTKFMKKKNQI